MIRTGSYEENGEEYEGDESHFLILNSRIEEAAGNEEYPFSHPRLSKDKRSLTVNRSLTLAGIPAEAFGYRLGNRSALEWVIDPYNVSTDKRSGITSDPNREDDPEHIVRLVGRVIQVSVETVGIVDGLPGEYCGEG